jgi:mannose-6-phosphate isomerase-like protein (cupin superfamily)
MGYEDLAPGAEIQPHTHLLADEILFVHRGTGVAKLGNREARVTAGATIYIPHNVQITVRNTGDEPLGVAFVFSKPGFEQLMRENSVLEGQPVTPTSAEEREQIRKRHSWHTVYPPDEVHSVAAASTPLVLAVEQGERRVRRAQSVGLSSPFILKVDAQNGGSPDLVMGYEDVPPGQAIAPHQHQQADEIIFVHRGSGVVELGTRTVPFTTGATIYIPKHVRIAVRNTETEPVSIAFVFSKPGFEKYLRETSVLEGEAVVPLSAAERNVIRARHEWHTVYEQP